MLSAALGAGALAVSLATSTLAPPFPPGATVEVTGFRGTGCPAGTTEVVPSPDRTAYNVHTPQFIVETGGRLPASNAKSCELTVRITPTPGHRAAIAEGLYAQGGVSVPEGGTAAFVVSYQNAGSSVVRHAHHVFNGPSEDSFEHVYAVPEASRVFGACGKPQEMTIGIEVILDTSGTESPSEGYAAIDFVSSSTDLFAWEEC